MNPTTEELEDKELPESFYCPLTHEVMTEPVVDPEGNTYERSAIEEWLTKNQTSPITRAPLKKTDLIPNRALRDVIESKLKELGIQPKKTEDKEKDKATDGGVAVQGSTTDDVSVSVRAHKVGTNLYDVLISVKPPAGTQRTPCDICCVVDISGSMGTEAKLKTTSGSESHGLSLLDITKHAVKTIAKSLLPSDRLALVVYSDTARTVFELTPMNDPAKARVLKQVDDLQTEGSTNLWDGLHTGLELLKKEATGGSRLRSLLLLTDGLPNISPPRGEVPMLKRYKEQNQQLSCIISTFGFGYDINSELLNEIAIEGSGMYAFIPDCSFVGTAFVNAAGNLLSTMAKNVHLSIEPLNGAKIEDNGVIGRYITNKTSWGAAVELSSLQYGQSRDVVVRMSIPDNQSSQPFLSATVKYEPWNSDKPAEASVEVSLAQIDLSSSVDVEAHRHRLTFIDTVTKAMALTKGKKEKQARDDVKAMVNEISNSPVVSDPRVADLLKDVEGQVTEAFSKNDYYTKWGQHYLPSLMRAHLLQQCNNFKVCFLFYTLVVSV